VVAVVAVSAAFAISVPANDRLGMSLSLGDTGVFEATGNYVLFIGAAVMFGGAIGLIVRQPAGAGAALEPLIGSLWTGLGDRLPFTAAEKALEPIQKSGADPFIGMGTMAGWIVLLAVVGLWSLQRSDV
jgi:hypothetical protein